MNYSKKILLGVGVLVVAFAAFSFGRPPVTEAVAVERVRAVSEVMQYQSDLEKAGSRAEFNVEDDGESWNVQVFEIVRQGEDSHTATFGWYKVNKKTGIIEREI